MNVCEGWRNPPWLPTRHCSVRAGLQYMSSVGLRRATAKGGVHARTCPSQGVPWRGSRTCEKAAQCEAREQESFSIWPRRGAPSVAHSERSPLFSFPRSPSWLVSCRDPRPWQHSYARKPFNLVVGRPHQQPGGVVCSLRRVLTPRVEVESAIFPLVAAQSPWRLHRARGVHDELNAGYTAECAFR